MVHQVLKSDPGAPKRIDAVMTLRYLRVLTEKITATQSILAERRVFGLDTVK